MSLDDLRFETRIDDVIPLEEYLHSYRSDPLMRLNAAGRVHHAFGTPKVIDTSKDPRLGIIFSNRTIKTYDTFADFYGIEETIMKIGQYFEYASKGVVQDGLILYLRGPVGSGKSSIAERILSLFETVPMWVLGIRTRDGKHEVSPIYESPLGLFNVKDHGDVLEERFKIPRIALIGTKSQWAARHLQIHDVKQFVAVKMMPSKARRIGIASVEPAVSEDASRGYLIGLAGASRRFEDYQYTGALNVTTQGIMDFSEIFDAEPKHLNPLLRASVDRKYSGEGAVGELPYHGVILAHSNEPSWEEIRDNKRKVNLLDRIYAVDVPYNVRLSAEVQHYQKYLQESEFAGIPMTPHVLELPARFAVLSRLVEPSIASLSRIDKMLAYDGSMHDGSGKTRQSRLASTDDFRENAKWRDGMKGAPTRFMQVLLTNAAQGDVAEDGLDPVLLFDVAKQLIAREALPHIEGMDLKTITAHTLKRMRELIEDSVQQAYVEHFDSYVEEEFMNYFRFAEVWADDQPYVDPQTGLEKPRAEIDKQLGVIEKAMAVTNPKDFRAAVVKAVWRVQGSASSSAGKKWHVLNEDERHRFVKAILPKRADMLPIVRIKQRDRGHEDFKKHEAFMGRLCAQGYTQRQAHRVVEWYCDDKNWS